MIRRLYHAIKVVFSEDKELYDTLKKLMGRTPRNLSLYKQAFTHRSAARGRHNNNTIHNERLEYLGDAVLGAVVADCLYGHYPSCKEGALTKMRSKLVNSAVLSRVALKHGLDKLLISQINLRFEGKFVLSDMVEAFVGAVYLDQGYNFTRKFVLDCLLKDFITENLENVEYDFKSRVLEWGQKNKYVIGFTSEIHHENNARARMFSAQVLVDDKVSGQGTGRSKKEAEQSASRSLWERLEKQQAT